MRVRPAVPISAFLRHMVLVITLTIVGTAESRAQATFSMEQLDALTAPIALYPDTLLAQVMIASTYPAEVAQAGQWAQQNSSLQGAALDSALQQQPWDASVKALVQTPSVLQQMNSKMDWTQQLGDAVLAQQGDVMASVQRLRQRAQSAGNLVTTAQQTVVTQPPAVAGGQQTIVIEQADPQVLYVPSYDTQVVYGGWPYPSYPPTYWPPPVGYGYPGYGYPGYAFGTGLMWGAGVAIGAAAWGNAFDWGGGDINVNANRNNFNNFNGGDRVNALNNSNRQNWQHNAADRRGSNYRDTATREKFGKTNTNAANARRESRGFDQGQRGNQGQLGNRGGQGQLGQGQRPNQGQLTQQLGQRGGQGQLGQGQRAGQGQLGQRPTQGQLSQQLGQRGAGGNQLAQNRSNMERRGQANGFDGAGNGARARQASARGSSSRQAMAQNANFRGGGGAGVNRGGGAGVNRGGGAGINRGGGGGARAGGGARGGGGGGRGGGGGGRGGGGRR